MRSWAQRAAKATAPSTANASATRAGGACEAGAAAQPPAQPMREPLVTGGAPTTSQGNNGNADGDDAYTLVQSRGRGRPGGGAASSAAATRNAEGENMVVDVEGDGTACGTEQGWTEEGGAQDDDGGAEQRPAHQVLWDELQKERAELKALRRQWPEGHWAVATAEERVGIAEAAWRSEKPSPLSSRALLRAEQAVRKAEGRESNLVASIKDLDAEYERKREEMGQALAEERSKLDECRMALQRVQEQVGAEGRRGPDITRDTRGEGVVRAAVSSLEADVALELAALVDGLDACGASDEVKQRAQALMARLHTVHGELHQLTESQGHRDPQAWWQYGQDSGGQHQQWYDMAQEESLLELSEHDWN